MNPGSTPDVVQQLSERVNRLEALVFEQQAMLVEQRRIMAEQRATIAAQHEALQTAREQISLLKKALFAPKRERYLPSPAQKLLFESTLVESPVAEAPALSSVPSVPKPPRKRRQKFVFPSFLPVIRHEHPLPPEELACHGCGCQRQLIKTLVTQQIELEPAKAHIEEHVRYRYACSKCRAGSALITTSKPPKPLEKSPFGASVLAWIIAAKFARHLPTYRQQEMLLEPLRMWLSRPLLAELLAGAARELRPLAHCGLREILRSAVVQADETPVRYLGSEPGKSSTGYLFGYAGDHEHRFLFYDYRATRSRAGPAEILADYRGVLLTDGFSGYESLVQESAGRLSAAACWMHARREFDEARVTTSHALVEETLTRIGLLYDLEERAKPLTHQERCQMRQREAGPLIEKLMTRLTEEQSQLRPTSPLAKAVQYTLNRRVELTRFLDDGRIELDTGLLERSLRGPALGRKNYLFFGSLAGGRTAATLYSVVQSAKLYDLDVTAYLTDVLRRLPAIEPRDQPALRELLPDRWAQTHPPSVLLPRQQESLAALEQRRQCRAQRRLAAMV